MTYGELYRLGKDTLEKAGVPEAELDARLLLEWVCGTDRNDLLVHGDAERSAGEQAAYERLIAARGERIPLQHLTGVQAFIGLEFAVDGHVLVPRQDTEVLVEEALRNLHDGMRILDMCTGSGCILISLLHYSNDCQGVGADISPDALDAANTGWRRCPKGHGRGGLPGARGHAGEDFVPGKRPVREGRGEVRPHRVQSALYPQWGDSGPDAGGAGA